MHVDAAATLLSLMSRIAEVLVLSAASARHRPASQRAVDVVCLSAMYSQSLLV